jgi:NADPH:quinone reductase-like Zn-dependent oxidoreductase
VLAVFRAAYEAGDLAGLVRLLHPDAVYVSDGGGKAAAARKLIRGGERIAEVMVRVGASGIQAVSTVRLAREAGARVIGTGRAADRDRALAYGVDAFLDLAGERLEDAGAVDVVFDVIGGDVLDRSAALVRAGGTLVTIAMPTKVQPREGRVVFFVVEPDRARLTDLAARLRDGRLKPVVGAVRPLAEAPAAFAPATRTLGKTIIRVTED